MDARRCPQCLQELREIVLLTSVEYECGCNSSSSVPVEGWGELHDAAKDSEAAFNLLYQLRNAPSPELIKGQPLLVEDLDLSDFVGQPVKQEVVDAIKARLEQDLVHVLDLVGFPWRPM